MAHQRDALPARDHGRPQSQLASANRLRDERRPRRLHRGTHQQHGRRLHAHGAVPDDGRATLRRRRRGVEQGLPRPDACLDVGSPRARDARRRAEEGQHDHAQALPRRRDLRRRREHWQELPSTPRAAAHRRRDRRLARQHRRRRRSLGPVPQARRYIRHAEEGARREHSDRQGLLARRAALPHVRPALLPCAMPRVRAHAAAHLGEFPLD